MENQRQLQQRIRQDAVQDAEETHNAVRNLSTWINTVKIAKPVPQLSTANPAEGGTYDEIRARGNEFFSQKQFAAALACYTRCLESKESLKAPTVYSNRAMAFLKLKQFANAEADCFEALLIRPTHVKSLHRRAVARLHLGKLRGALLDVYAAEDNCDTDALTDLKSKCEQALVEAVKRAPRRNVRISVE